MNTLCSVSSTDQLAQILVWLHFDLVISYLFLDKNAVEMLVEMLIELILLEPSIGNF